MSLDVIADLVWFTQVVKEYEVIKSESIMKFLMTDRDIKIDWDNCAINIGKMLPDGNIQLVIRSKTNRNSDYMGSIPVELRFMLTIDVKLDRITEPRLERNYSVNASERRNLPRSVRQIVHDRWVFSLGNKGDVWEWTRQGMDIRSSKVYHLYQYIRKFIDAPENEHTNIIRVEVDKLDEIVPVIYQPAIDSLGNFLREIHCAQINEDDDSVEVEVSLLFNNEQLRRSRMANGFYEWFRKLFYGRVIDVETFRIHFVRDRYDENYFIFKGIYSGDRTLEFDTIHFDNPPNVPHRPIGYYFSDHLHPIVFINTSNHALAGHDNNPNLWKWEYVSWIEKSPVVRGKNTRMKIDKQFKSLIDRILNR